MSLATELLFNAQMRPEGDRDFHSKEVGEDSLGKWAGLNHVVYALIDTHEPSPELDARLRADLRMMQLSGLLNELDPSSPMRVYKHASQIMTEFLRLLPRTR